MAFSCFSDDNTLISYHLTLILPKTAKVLIIVFILHLVMAFSVEMQHNMISLTNIIILSIIINHLYTQI